MIYLEAPNKDQYDKEDYSFSLFLAGGITNCPDWQKDMLHLLADQSILIYSPRRKNFPIHNPNAAYEQIKWEFDYLAKADVISFWFCKEIMCPIVLYELGRWANTKKKIFVGVDPLYPRRQDVEIQLQLARPDIEIVYDINSLVDKIKAEGAQSV